MSFGSPPILLHRKVKSHGCFLRIDFHVSTVPENPVRGRLVQLCLRKSRRQGGHPRTGSVARPNSGGYVLKDKASRRRDSEQRRTLQIRLRVGFPVNHIRSGYDSLGNSQPSSPETRRRKVSGARSDDGPPANRKALQQLDRTREGDHALHVLNLPALDDTVFCIVISAGQVMTDRAEARATVGVSDHLDRIKPMPRRPSSPNALHGWCGVDQNSVEIKEQGVALDLNHVLQTILSFGDRAVPRVLAAACVLRPR